MGILGSGSIHMESRYARVAFLILCTSLRTLLDVKGILPRCMILCKPALASLIAKNTMSSTAEAGVRTRGVSGHHSLPEVPAGDVLGPAVKVTPLHAR